MARAGAEDWQAVRDIRLAALLDAPFAFGSTLERELAFDEQEWQRRVSDGNWLLAWFGQQPVGVVAGIPVAGRHDERHLVGMWVTAAHRGTSVAAELVEAICDWTRSQGASLVTLWVADGNPRARRFYDRLGFITTGRRQPLPSAPEIGEELLQRHVDARSTQKATPEIDPAIVSFYQDRYDEEQRLVRSPHGRLEFRRTQQLLRRYLPPPGSSVLDVGGGTGIHARWLAQDGYHVHLIDPIGDHVRKASRNPGITAQIGDARDLPVVSKSVDVVLLLGPLYHLIEAVDRQQALQEAIRVLRPGGLVIAAAISRYAPLLELAGLGKLDDDAASEVAQLIETGINRDDPSSFTVAYFHRPEELRQELIDAGLSDVHVLGIEGPSVAALDNAPKESMNRALDSAARCAQLVETDPALMAASPHLLGLGSSGVL